MVKNILKGLASPFQQALDARAQGQASYANQARQNQLGAAANVGGLMGGGVGAAAGGQGGFIPEIWSQEMLTKMKQNTVLGQMAGGMSAQSAVPPPQTCPLSKAIIMDALLDLMELQPDMHMGEILRQVMDDSRHRTYDVELSQSITGLVDSLRHACKNDSFSETPRPDSSERKNPQSIGPVGGVPPFHRLYEPPPAFQPASLLDSEQPDLFLPLG